MSAPGSTSGRGLCKGGRQGPLLKVAGRLHTVFSTEHGVHEVELQGPMSAGGTPRRQGDPAPELVTKLISESQRRKHYLWITCCCADHVLNRESRLSLRRACACTAAPHTVMGKKGLGRKAFVKAAMAQPSGRGEEQDAGEPSNSAQAGEDVTPSAEVEQQQQSVEAPQQPNSAADLSVAPPPPDIPVDETRGQALQRHKRVRHVRESAGNHQQALHVTHV